MNGSAAGTITIDGSFPRGLTNIYAQNQSGVADIDLVITRLDLRTAPFDAGGNVVDSPGAGTTLYPHIFFDVVGGTVPAITVYEIKLGDQVLCNFSGSLEAGSYWANCDPILVPSGQFMLSGRLDPDIALDEPNENNNALTQTYITSDLVFEDSFE